jgi:hypothetical protein
VIAGQKQALIAWRGTGRRSALERGLRLLGDLAERCGIADGELGEHLAVELDAGLAAAGDELVIGEALCTGSGVDADDPEAPEVPLSRLAIAVGVLERVLDLLPRRAIGLAPPTDVALRRLEDLRPPLSGLDRSLDARY